MATRTLGRVVRTRCLNDTRIFAVSNASWQSHCDVRVGRVYGDIIGSNVCDRDLARASPLGLISCLSRVHTAYSVSPEASCRGQCTGFPNVAGAMLFYRSFAAKTKKSKSRSEETVEVDEDVAGLAKENAVKMMETALDVLSREHAKLRTGRVSSGMLDHITVDAHGVRTPLTHVAAVSVAGLQTLSVLPYDPSMVKEVEKALLMSPLGLNPVVEGSTLTVPVPRLTKEVCESMCKLAVKSGETAKLSIRRARKDALDRAKSAGLSKDEMKRFEKEVEELTKKFVKTTDELCKKKEKEILT